MKKSFKNSIILGAAILFSAAQVKANDDTRIIRGVSEQTTYAGSHCGNGLSLNGMDLNQSEVRCDQDAIAKCNGPAERSSEYSIVPSCVETHVWNSAYTTVTVSALYECIR